MNLLALVNRTRRECGVSMQALASLTGLGTEDTRVLEWVQEAWHDLQLHKPDWSWMRKSFTFATIASQVEYTPTQAGASDAADWKRDTLRCYTTAVGYGDEQILPFLEYESFRDVYLFGANRTLTPGRPVVFTIEPGTKNLVIGPVPAAGYTVLGDYYRLPTDLTAATDDPSSTGNDLQTRWHMLIVYYAMKSYAAYENAPEVMARANTEMRRLMQRLEYEQLPTIGFGAPLA